MVARDPRGTSLATLPSAASCQQRYGGCAVDGPGPLCPVLHSVVVVVYVLIVPCTGSQTPRAQRPFAVLLEAESGGGWRPYRSCENWTSDRADSFCVFPQHMPLVTPFQGQGYLRHPASFEAGAEVGGGQTGRLGLAAKGWAPTAMSTLGSGFSLVD